MAAAFLQVLVLWQAFWRAPGGVGSTLGAGHTERDVPSTGPLPQVVTIARAEPV